MVDHLRSKGAGKRQQTIKNGYLLVHQLPQSGVAEAYRNLKTKLIFSSPDKELKTILVTSALPGEGKTFNTISLGIVMAHADKKVLIVEADMRRPIIGRAFSLGSQAESIGLSSLVMKRLAPEDVIMKTPVENLMVLPAGPKPPNPSELLGSESMREALERLSSVFDLLILDSPPVLGLPDVLNVASKVDGCLLVIKYSKTSYKDVIRAKETIEMVKGYILGTILNRVKPQPFGYGYGGYGGYYHGYYYHSYGYGEEEEARDLKEKEPGAKRRPLFKRKKK